MSSQVTSPIRVVQSPANTSSNINFDESFSPVKLPVKTPIKDLLPETNHHKTPDLIIQHPHGLTAKHGARAGSSTNNIRRNTLGNPKRKSLVETPLIASGKQALYQKQSWSAKQPQTHRDTVVSGYPLTSPRLNYNKKPIDIESIRQSKIRLDSKLNDILLKGNGDDEDDGKENKNPFESSPALKYIESNGANDTNSSPLKRTAAQLQKDTQAEVESEEGSAKKIAKIVTNANDHENSIQVDEVFYKEDLVGQLSKSSPNVSKIRSSPNVSKIQQSTNPTIVDNDSDSEVEDYGRIENTISQTILPNTIGLTGLHNNKFISSDITHTQLGKIIRSEDVAKDLITPQRYTEPIAKSPDTNQHVRVNTLDNVLEGDNDDEEEDEIDGHNTSRLRDATSPLKNHVSKTGHYYDHNDEEIVDNERLENEPTINFLMSPNSKPVFSLEHISKIQRDHEKRTSDFISQLTTKDDRILTLSNELSHIQDTLIQFEKEVRSLKETKTKLRNNEEILSIQLKHNERELASLTKSYKMKENTVHGLRSKLDNVKSKHEEEISSFNDTVESQANEIHDLKRQLTEATSLNIEYNIKIEKLLKEKEELLNDGDAYKAQNSQLSSEVEKLQTQQKELYTKLDELKARNIELGSANAENESLIKEFESVANTKINELETTIANINKEKEEIYKNLAEAEEYEHEIKSLKTELEEMEDSHKKLSVKLDHLEESNARLKNDSHNFESILKDKDDIINEDISKMTELVEAVNKKEEEYSQRIDSLEETIYNLKKDKNSALEQVESLTDQVENTKVEADNEVKRLAQYLHHEYAEKHAKKLGDVKIHYEKEKESLIREKRYAEREVELLKKKLHNSLDEIRQLTEFIDVNKLQYQGSNMTSRLSPKKSGNSNRGSRH